MQETFWAKEIGNYQYFAQHFLGFRRSHILTVESVRNRSRALAFSVLRAGVVFHCMKKRMLCSTEGVTFCLSWNIVCLRFLSTLDLCSWIPMQAKLLSITNFLHFLVFGARHRWRQRTRGYHPLPHVADFLVVKTHHTRTSKMDGSSFCMVTEGASFWHVPTVLVLCLVHRYSEACQNHQSVGWKIAHYIHSSNSKSAFFGRSLVYQSSSMLEAVDGECVFI